MKKAFTYFSIIVVVLVIVYAVFFFLFIYEGAKVSPVIEKDFILDSNANTNVSGNLNTNASVTLKYCDSAEDCQAVGCQCSCSGCGGFSYEDVVNKDYADTWYTEHDCQEAEVCPEVCCQEREITCEENTCKVVETPSE